VQRARENMLANRPFLEQARCLVQAAGAALPYGEHPLLTPREGNRAAVLVISGDRGLCGGYNLNVCKALSALAKKHGDLKIIAVGSKAADFCAQRFQGQVVRSYTGISESPFYEDAEAIAAALMGWYESGEACRVYVIYTQFRSMLSQQAVTKTLLPIEIEPGQASKIRFEIPPKEAFSHAVPFYVTAFVYGAILESAACEHSARIATMDAAVRNAGGMIDSLTLLYHQARQGEITREIIEIVSGADAIACEAGTAGEE